MILFFIKLLEKLKNRAIFPFPIDVSTLSNSILKQTIVQLNQNFSNSLTNAWIPADIEECSGDQDFQCYPDLEDSYYELLSIMISSCYKCGLKDATKVLVGDVNKTQKCGFKLELSCSCSLTEFHKEYFWVSPSDLLSIKDKQLVELKKIEFEKCDNPKLNRGDHHAPFMPRNVQLKKYSDISYSCKSVLNILQYFRLNCITFKEFHKNSSEIQGTLVISTYRQNETNGIIYGNLYLKKGFYSKVKLVFPPGVGKCIVCYCDKK